MKNLSRKNVLLVEKKEKNMKIIANQTVITIEEEYRISDDVP